jgi:hypothetical protein
MELSNLCRPLIGILAGFVVAACGPHTPKCTDQQVLTQVRQLAAGKIEETLVRADPAANPASVLSRIEIAVDAVSLLSQDQKSGKLTCSADVRFKLPAEVFEHMDHPVFRAAVPKSGASFQADHLVSPVSFTVARDRQSRELIVEADGLDAPARFVRGAYFVGVFTSDLRTLPDLRAGLILYNAKGKHLIIQPTDQGPLQFQFNFENPTCRAWMQYITEERGSTLVYDNRSVGCSVVFSLLGEALLVEHKGCELMVPGCFPDGVYRKQ